MKKYYDDRKQLNMKISDAEDGVMKVRLHQPSGIREITVTEATGKEIIELNRIEYNANHRETRRHVSLEAYDPYDVLVSDDDDPYQETIEKEETDQLYEAIHQLRPEQQELLFKKYEQDMKQNAIAKEEGVSKMAITKRLQTIYRNLRKYLEK